MRDHPTISESKRTRIGAHAPRRPQSKKEEQEYGSGKKDFVICPDCGAVYHFKSWHHSLNEVAKDQTPEKFAEKHDVVFEICPACDMKNKKVYEGEVVIKLGRAAQKHKEEILKTVEGSDKLARERDPMDRILWIEDKDSEIHVFTSENQLAVKMGKNLDSAFKGGRLEIKYSGEDTARVVWEKFN